MIKVENLTIEYREKLFDSINFILGNKEKVGLIGLNGSGKSTLLKIINGLEKPDKGSVHLVNEKVEYLPQEFDFPKDMLVGEFLEDLVSDPYSEMYKIERILAKLKILDIDYYQYIDVLSPGQKMKLYLVKLLINEPTILLLDEPTNHLDIYGIMWLEDFIKSFDGICIIISHDRTFLNNVIDKVLEIDEKKLYSFEGNYDDYLIGKEQLIAERERLYKAQEKKRKKMEQLIENMRKMSNGEKRGRAVEAAKKRMEREVLRNEISAYEEKKIDSVKIRGEVYKTKKLLEVKNLKFGYSKDRLLINDLNLEIFGSEKIWFYGPNGIGKSTLIKLLIDQLKPISGEIKWGANIKYEYFSQDQSHLPMTKKVMDYFTESTGINFYQAGGVLQKFLFDPELRNMEIGKLSPGQRARLSFAIFAQHAYDFLILDEPTNHLDIKTKEIIEEGLKDFKGGILLVSHDRYFSENIEPTKIVTLEDGKLIEL